jgi:hypothetical protein
MNMICLAIVMTGYRPSQPRRQLSGAACGQADSTPRDGDITDSIESQEIGASADAQDAD